MVLDNCEHLLDASAALAQPLLEALPRDHRAGHQPRAAAPAGEMVWRVPSLALPDPTAAPDPEALAQHDSVQLFLRRARRRGPPLPARPRDGGPVARICLRLDGMPLALELAAARTAHLAPAQLADLLDDALATLATRTRGVPDRQATLDGHAGLEPRAAR